MPSTRIASISSRWSGAEVRADRGGAGAGDDEHGHDGAQLSDGAERRTGTRQVGGADLAKQNVERERHQHGEWDCDKKRRDQRDARDHPGLVEEFSKLKGATEDLDERVQGHFDEPAHGPSRCRKLFDQPRLRSRGAVFCTCAMAKGSILFAAAVLPPYG
jgi:hypothetical protein